ncbi:hypothetical protein AMS68_006660 [Peltaster fructicola]|uniref:Copper acquisition factor BIM1-like domain-containing protein n=1 Tax=Peltaster fructicola TaxID=286661 RepID=A0A6H0Y296_9PEZI|nr:hypothetical protein AMS68_006660 [Peltaster fructicola]
MFCRLPVVLALASCVSAHFNLIWPPTAGFDDDVEGTSPCGGATVMVNSSSPQVSVDRFAALIRNGHPTGSFAFLATTDTSAPYNFTLLQNVSSTGLGTFCANYIHAPSSFAGKAGVIQVIDQSVDGVLYQCAPVNFVSGSNDTLGSACQNGSGVALSYSGSQSTASSTTSLTTSANTATAVATKSSGMAAMATVAAPVLAGLGVVAAGLVL